ncbi:unnamed protein product (plasmid) [Mycetohabitans rhizoxinica HKI 454]|uniref:Uncharacterized protein n=1 Tax=Mycetohabitans rhizoxinica (strain DSM 19002 / CIP 109453 / HKI 454) TaxID=882378 RepID=E5AW39_MYCRK|nr:MULTISPECIES: hypothetical protein [Mycetohabitans]MCF7697065.1 hypothetical protein [Mycetohabitans sp. B2]MCG1048741.1 hypothetical protein [Mycetohabitans sp. B6]CBW77341.1 unnamed protein product [Mycetohabitans rhizoxinica HKI 454]
MDFNTTPPPNPHNAAIYASVESHKSGPSNSPPSGFFSAGNPNTAQRQAPANSSGIAPMERVHKFLKKTLREKDGPREIRIEPLRQLLDELNRDVVDSNILLAALDRLAMSGINEFPRAEQTEAFTHIFAEVLKIPNSKALQDKMIHHFESDYNVVSTTGLGSYHVVPAESMIAVFDAILSRTIASPLEERRKILPLLALQLDSSHWTGEQSWAAVHGRPYNPRPELTARFDRLLSEMARLDDIGRAKLSAELANQLFLLHCLDRTLVLNRHQRLLNYVEALPEKLQSIPRKALGRAIRWLPEHTRLATYESMLEAAKRLSIGKGEALAGLPEALAGLTAAEQNRRLQQWKYEILPMLDLSDQEPIVAGLIAAFGNLAEGNNPEFALALALDTFERTSGGQSMDKERFSKIILEIRCNSKHTYSPETLGRILDLGSGIPPSTREILLLDLEEWLDWKFFNKALGTQEQLFLPIQARIRDERAKLAPEPLLNLDPDPLPVTWWEDPDRRKVAGHADGERRRRPIVDWIKVRLGRR